MTDQAPRGRGRPKGTGRVDPDDIIEAALDALASGGYQALTMRGVARRLGVSLASLQYHHATKADLWRAAIDGFFADAADHHGQVDVADLARSISVFLQQGARRPGLVAALLTDRSEGSEERLAYIADGFAANTEQAHRKLEALQSSGTVRPLDPKVMFALTTIGIGSLASAGGAVKAIYGFDLENDEERDRFAAAVADIIGHGLLKR